MDSRRRACNGCAWRGAFVAVLALGHSGLINTVRAEELVGDLRIRRSRATGTARFVTPAGNKTITVPLAPGRQGVEPIDFFRVHGQLFGITDVDRQLVEDTRKSIVPDRTRTTFRQVHNGVPVFAALLRVHTDEAGQVVAANGTFIPDIKISTTPVFGDGDAIDIAVREIADQKDAQTELTAVSNGLMIFRANLARGIPGPNHLVYEIEVTNGANIREFVYVDAHKGFVVDQITGIHEAIDRRIYDGGFSPSFLVWSEGDSTPFGNVDIDHLIDYAEDTYNLAASTTDGSFLSWDGVDGVMHSVNDDPGINCPNANWNGTSTNYCTGVTGDDTVAHEWGHAYTDSTHNLIYQWQPGALNESYSDIWGEVVDFLNGSGTDSPVPLRGDGECSTFGGSPPPLCEVNSPTGIAGAYPAGDAAFNPTPPVSVTADVEYVNDGDDEGGAGTVTDGCQSLIGFSAGRIALIDRGACTFVSKVTNAINAGAVGVIVVNNQGDGVIFMGGAGLLTIPAVMIGQSDGQVIKDELPGVNVTIELALSTDPSYRWLAGEDSTSFGGAIRDMWNPNCMGDPGKVTDVAQYFCGTGDSGGVHTNSGIPNHAFALLADGGTYNGHAIAGIGLTKAFHLYWWAQRVYQGPASDFADHADALEQSCQDLIGVNLFALNTEVPTGSLSGEVITSGDCGEVTMVVAAVELRTEPTQCGFGPLLDPNTPSLCTGETSFTRTILHEDWESGLGSWTVGTRAVLNPPTFDTPDWAVVGNLPDGRAGDAAFVADLIIGNCQSDTEAGVLYLESPPITLPAWAVVPRVALDHWVATEANWDGGNIKISVNGGAWTLISSSAFEFNAYNSTLNVGDNPIGGEDAFTGSDGGSLQGTWGQSQIDLSGIASAGDDIQLRFEFGIDGCNGLVGWYVDDVHVFACSDADIPTVSEWGLAVMVLLILTAGTMVLMRRPMAWR